MPMTAIEKNRKIKMIPKFLDKDKIPQSPKWNAMLFNLSAGQLAEAGIYLGCLTGWLCGLNFVSNKSGFLQIRILCWLDIYLWKVKLLKKNWKPLQGVRNTPLWGSSISYLKALKPKSFKICLIHLDWQQQVSAHKITKTQPLTTAPPSQPTPIPPPEPWPRPKPKSKSITKPSQCQQECQH